MYKSSVNISTHANQPDLSKTQQIFNQLIRQIEQGRAALNEWEALRGTYQQKFRQQLLPLLKDAEDLHVKIVYALDEASAKSGFSKRERIDIANLLTEMAHGLLAIRDDEGLKAIFNKYSDISYDDIEAESRAEAKSLWKDMFGMDLDDNVDLRSPESVLEHAQAQLRKQNEQQEAAEQARQDARAKRRKSPKQLAKEAQHEANERQLRLSIREIYRKLASALHPDREPDAEERSRKTALMQRVNQAYEKNNLLQLLELQLELEHIDQSALNNVSEERLKHYIQILRGQLNELREEIVRVQGTFVEIARFDSFSAITPKTVMKALANEIADTQHNIRQLKKDLQAFDSMATLKTWLKSAHRELVRDSSLSFPF